MGIFTRFRDIVSANINAMLDRAEDPEKMIKMMIAGRKKLQRRLDEISERQTLWAQRAQLAVEKGRDDLAREALQEKRRFTEISERLEHEISEHSGLINQYHEDVRALEAKLTSAKEKKRMLIERHRKARNKKRAQEDIRRMDSSETMARFEHLENRIERMEAEADMVNFGTTAGVAEQFDTLATDEEIEKELARMKGETYDTRNTSQSDNQA
ncbi:MAG: PspA/IM30 family protein [Desulfofustis sp. PB-SRB1]|nr:PspA/IM30 family protein [Desulfofustis sp. PB-SRB1]